MTAVWLKAWYECTLRMTSSYGGSTDGSRQPDM